MSKKKVSSVSLENLEKMASKKKIHQRMALKGDILDVFLTSAKKKPKIEESVQIIDRPLDNPVNILEWVKHMSEIGVSNEVSIAKMFKHKFVSLKKCKQLNLIKCSEDYSYFFNLVSHYNSSQIESMVYINDNVYLAKLIGINIDPLKCLLYNCHKVYHIYQPQIIIEDALRYDADSIFVALFHSSHISDTDNLFKRAIQHRANKCFIALVQFNLFVPEVGIDYICVTPEIYTFSGSFNSNTLYRCSEKAKKLGNGLENVFDTHRFKNIEES